MSTSRDQMLGRTSHFLLDFDVGGRVYRFGTAALEIASDTGEIYRYAEGLRSLSVSAMGQGGAEASMGVQILSEDDWSALEAQFITLDRRRTTLRRYFEGQQLQQAEVLLTGFSHSVEYGAASDPLTMSITRRMKPQSQLLPSPQMRVDAVTWPDGLYFHSSYSRDPKLDGSAYPVIVGRPGQLPAAAAAAAVPGLLVSEQAAPVARRDDLLLVAGHRVAASTVRIFDFSFDPPLSADMPIVELPDALGRMCSLVNFRGTALEPPAKGRPYYTGWLPTEGGGIISPRTGNTLTGAGEVLLYFLEQYTDVILDSGRMELQSERLDSIKIDAFLNTSGGVNVWEWLTRTLLPLLPVSPMQGEHGLYFQVWRWDATAEDAVAHLVADGINVSRRGMVRDAGIEIRNEITVEYRQDRATNRYSSRTIVTGERGFTDRQLEQLQTDADTRVLPHYACTVSQQNVEADDVPRVLPLRISASVIWDAPSATDIAMWKASKHALPKRSIQLSTGNEWEWLRVGDVVVVTVDAWNIAERVAIISDKTIGGPEVLFTLILLDHPVHSFRTG